jgi:hypothetical protein
VRSHPDELLSPFLGMLGLIVLSTVDAALYHIQPLSVFAACAGMIAAGWRNPSARE